MRYRPLLSIALICLPVLMVQAQQTERAQQVLEAQRYVPQWQGETTVAVGTPPAQDSTLPALSCQDCHYAPQLPNLPYYELLVPVEQGERIEARLQTDPPSSQGQPNEHQSASRERITDLYQQASKQLPQGAWAGSEWYPARPIQAGPVMTIRKQRYQRLRFYPVQVHKSGVTIRQYDRMAFKLVRNQRAAQAAQKHAGTDRFAQESPLRQGTWHKLPITATGMYRLDYEFLKSNGLSPEKINPATIQIYGNGGGMLPQPNDAPRPGGLQENAIQGHGTQDGSFDKGDYFLFYAEGPDAITYEEGNGPNDDGRLRHIKNYQADTNYYFLTHSQSNGKRIGEASSPANPTLSQSTSPQISVLHKDKHNLLEVSRVWMGDEFDLQTSRDYSLSAPRHAPGTDAELTVRIAARGNRPTRFAVQSGGQTLGQLPVSAVSFNSNSSTYARIRRQEFTLDGGMLQDNQIVLSLNYQQENGSKGWLDYMELRYQQQLQPSGAQMRFYGRPAGLATARAYKLTGAEGYQVWDVTTPYDAMRRPLQNSGGQQSFSAPAERFRKFVAFKGGNFPTPAGMQPVTNQNLHALAPADYLMVTHSVYRGATERLANFHRRHYGRSVHVVSLREVYNEFASGRRDVTAIRDFARMLYDRASSREAMPRYLLLMGKATYDLRQRKHEGNFVPTYLSRKPFEPTSSFSSDDYFTFLDPGEGFWGESVGSNPYDDNKQVHYLDLGVGRLPAKTPAEAEAMVDKIIEYHQHPDRFGEWRTRGIFAADWKEGEETHMQLSEEVVRIVQNKYGCMNMEKLYIDSYPTERQADGIKYPEAKQDYIRMLNEGALLMNYSGHGGETGFSNAQILETPDIQKLKNEGKYHFWITATCSFGRYDDPALTSGAETALLLPEAGAIGLLTSVRQVYVSGNKFVNKRFVEELFHYAPTDGGYPTLGEAYRHMKNKAYNPYNINSRNFILLGDPGMKLAYPEHKPVITSVTRQGQQGPIPTDTLKALSQVTLKGEMRTRGGQKLANFNGKVDILILDKPNQLRTLKGNYAYDYRKTKLFDGQASVRNGEFSLQLTMPLDISYETGKGKIILYAQNGRTDGLGCSKDLTICCTDSNANFQSEPPQVELMMNNDQWQNGDMVSPNPDLFARVKDDQGINTTGLGVGRDLKAVLDGDEANPIILNGSFEAKQDNASEGTIRYQLTDLSDGEHSLRIKVWDVTNNSAVDSTTFIVADDARMALKEILAYPNPFRDKARIKFKHNQRGNPLRVKINIYNQNGQRVRGWEQRFTPASPVSDAIAWDGRGPNGQRLSPGFYTVRLQVVSTETGAQEAAVKKLILLR